MYMDDDVDVESVVRRTVRRVGRSGVFVGMGSHACPRLGGRVMFAVGARCPALYPPCFTQVYDVVKRSASLF